MVNEQSSQLIGPKEAMLQTFSEMAEPPCLQCSGVRRLLIARRTWTTMPAAMSLSKPSRVRGASMAPSVRSADSGPFACTARLSS